MITFIWRGLGIIVPIVFFITGWIVSYWFEDTRFGNASYVGWVSFYSAIVLLLPGIGLWSGDKDEEGKTVRAHFMFIPVLIWSLGLGGLSAYLLLTRDSGPAGNTATVQNDDHDRDDVSAGSSVKTYRVVNFINSSTDSMRVIIRYDGKKVEEIAVGPRSWIPREMETRTYTFTSYDKRGKEVMILKDKQIAEAKKGDYTDCWIQLDGGEHDLVLMDVTPALPADFKKSDLNGVDWTKQVVKVYKGNDLMSFDLSIVNGGNTILEPGDLLPLTTKEKTMFSLITVPSDQQLTNDYLVERLGNLYFE